jgi:hypothetical protein
VLASSAWHWGHGPRIGADDHGQYLLHARALIQGRSYVDIGFIHTPFTTLIAPVAEPPALPLVITAIFAVAGESVALVRAVLVLSLAGLALLVWQYFRRFENETTAVVIAAWTVVALARLHVVDTVLADIPFAAALWLTLLIADSAPPERPWRHYLALALAGAVAFGFRMAALPLLPGIACYVLLRPAAERPGLLAAGAIWTLTALGVLFLLPGADSLGSEVARAPSAVLRDVLTNFDATLGGARSWIPITLPWLWLNRVVHALVLLLTAWGALIALREQPRRFAFLTAAWYLIMLAAIPTASGRYLWPLYPLLTFALIRGLRWVAATLTLGARSVRLALAAAALLLAAGLLQDIVAPRPRTLSDHADAQAVVQALQREAQQRTVRTAFFSPRVLTWYTGITATAFGDGPPDALYDEVQRQGLTHVVVGDAGTSDLGRNAIARMVAQHQQAFVPLLQNSSFVLYEVRRPSDTRR